MLNITQAIELLFLIENIFVNYLIIISVHLLKMAALKQCKACNSEMQCKLVKYGYITGIYSILVIFIHFMRVLYNIEYGSIPYYYSCVHY